MARPAHPVSLTATLPAEGGVALRTPAWPVTQVLYALRRTDPAAAFGLFVVSMFVLAAVLAPLIEPRDPIAQDISLRLRPPGFLDPRTGTRFWLGSDGLGRDILSRL